MPIGSLPPGRDTALWQLADRHIYVPLFRNRTVALLYYQMPPLQNPAARRIVKRKRGTHHLSRIILSVTILAMQNQLQDIYAHLFAHFGPQHWWPGNGAFEVIVGAILTQNTAWTNVEKAMANLKREHLLTPAALERARVDQVAQLVRPSGYYNLKAKKLKAFVDFLVEKHHGRLAHLFAQDTASLREELLAVYGIGPETADSIILYAANQPIFVVDAYTRRIAARLGLAREDVSYDELQQLFMSHLPRDAVLFNEYHALLVALGKYFCLKTKPRCGECPLQTICPKGKQFFNTGNAVIHSLSP